ncbi:MAG: hypothetical protein TEF_10485 [Rhizobiales bacterium NRL2]|jgi:trigger factor|nr:MAG: hypothetical protein TEF_10485 [Rhizobiales bacterium NRL2]
MQIEQLSAEGLKREYKIVVPAEDVEAKMSAKLKELSGQVQMKGFRPGKVPPKLLRQMYGKSILGEVLEETLNESSQKALEDNDVRPAVQPSIEIESFDEGQDLAYKMSLEILPDFEIADLSSLEVERLTAEVPDETVDSALERLAQDQTTYEKIEEDRPAAEGDAIVIDFVGKVDGEPFEGGAGEEVQIVLGQGQFVPGFEEQLVGKKAGDETVVTITFPEEYGAKDLAGKEANFDVTVREIRAARAATIDDDFAKQLGLDDLAALRETMRGRIAEEYGEIGRMRLKREVLDKLAERHDFEVPPGMVETEYDQIVRQAKAEDGQQDDHDHDHDHDHEHDHEHDHDHDHEHDHEHDHPPVDEGLDDEKKDEYRKIAERRVRLGLVLAEIGRENKLEVTPDEVNREIMKQARNFPGQERMVVEFYQKNPDAMQRLRAPVFEDKVIDFIVEMAKVSERKVSPEELSADPDADEENAAASA